MIMGTEMRDAATRRAEHVLRMPLAHKSVLAHNIFAEPSANKHALKLHNQGDCVVLNDCDVNPVQSAENYPTSWVLIRENLFQSNTDIVVNIGPGTSKVGEQVNNILFESNRVEASGALNQFSMVLTGHDSTIENNQLIQNFPTTSWIGVSVAQGRNEVEHAHNNRVINNSVEANGSIYMVRLGSETYGAEINNNVVCSSGQINYVDLLDADVTYSAVNNVSDCTGTSPDQGLNNDSDGTVDDGNNNSENNFTAPLFHLSFDNNLRPAMDITDKVSPALNGDTSLVEGVVGQAIVFDEVGDEIIIADPMANIDNTGEFSLMTWIKVTDFSTGGEAFGRPRLNRQGDVSLTVSEQGEVLFYVNSKHIYPGITLQQGQWAHLALTFDLLSRSIKVFANGSEVYQYVFPQSSDLFFNTGQEFRLGLGQWRSSSSHFSGQLDEFKFYESVLSADEITRHVSAELLP